MITAQISDFYIYAARVGVGLCVVWAGMLRNLFAEIRQRRRPKIKKGVS
jgi:hypothetical protein